MALEWNDRRDRFDPNGGNGRGSFQEHNERMREFRRSHACNPGVKTPRRDSLKEHVDRMGTFRESHADVPMVNAPRRDGSALLEDTWPLQVPHTMMETGGSRGYVSAEDWSAFVPLWRVARYKLSQN